MLKLYRVIRKFSTVQIKNICESDAIIYYNSILCGIMHVIICIIILYSKPNTFLTFLLFHYIHQEMFM